MSEPSRAVFLSYASQDAQAALKICAALRGAGIEVWFDQSDLRGGDAWDQSIRKQIKSCALFLPVISHTTHDRREGYFRLEWKLAIDRCNLMDANLTFLLPVVIDNTRDDDERVPERFREVQWTRVPGGETPPAFVERVQRLLSQKSAGETWSTAVTESAPATSVQSPPPSRSKRTLLALGAGALAVALVVVLGYFGVERLRASGAGVQRESIAVLPLANESGDAEQQYFSDGISEDLITALSQFPGLKVIGRTSSFQFRDRKEDSRSIGAKLQVAYLLEGSVRRSGDVVRVSAELIKSEDGSTAWSERYDRPYNDLFALQDEITHAVAGALRTKLLPGDHAAAQSERPPSGSLEAFNAFLQGQFYAARLTEADLRKAIELYTQATELDPRYALAWSKLSRTWAGLAAQVLQGQPAREAYVKARAAADRALSLSPDLAAVHLARGYLLQRADLDWRGAATEFRRATELAPNDSEAKFLLGNQLATYGDLEQAIELTHEALATEPLRNLWHYWLATYFSGLNQLGEAERAIRRALEIQPGAPVQHEQLTIIAIQRGDARAALAAAQQETDKDWREIALALALQIGSDRSAADAALETLIDHQAIGAPYQIAQVHALRNDAKETFDWLDRAWSSRDAGILYLLFDPFILRYKDDPRFTAFCRKVGAPMPGSRPSKSA